MEPRKCVETGGTTPFKWRKSRRAETCRPVFVRLPGVADHGMHDTTRARQPGRPHDRFRAREKVRTTEGREEGPIGHGESDRLVVPRKASNVAGGKEVTRGRAT